MANLYRALRWVCLLSALVASFSVHALLSTLPVYQFSRSGHVGTGATPEAACANLDELLRANTITAAQFVPGSPDRCLVFRVSDNATLALLSYTMGTPVCPPNSSPVTGGCQCNSGYAEVGGVCSIPEPTCPAAGTKSEREWSAVLPASFTGEYFYTSNEMDGGTCELKVKAEICVKESATATTQTCVGSATWTGEDATGSGDGTAPGSAGTPAGSGDTAEEAMQNATGCPTGQCPGTVNGLNVCKPCNGTSTVKPKVEEKQNPDGTSEKKETTEKTTCVGNTCTTESTTTTTNKDASGTVTGTSTVTTTTQQGKGDYCKENPREPQCDDEGSWGGSCTAGFTCKGDAATCALAKEVHERNCKLNEETAASALYGTAKDATGNVTGDNPNNSTFDVGPSSFNTSDAIGGAQCIADLEVTVWGSALSLPLSDICTPLAYMGNLLVMVSLLLAARIVSRG